MQIIENYKNNIKTSFEHLLKDGIISQEEKKIVELEENQFTKNQNYLFSQTQIKGDQNVVTSPNPYKIQKNQSLHKRQSNKSEKCVVCSKPNPKYRCPQCQIQYCSSSHYKTHNLFCSQNFFQKQVENALKGMKSQKKQKQKVIQLLKEHNELLEQQTSFSQNKIKESRLMQILKKIQEKENMGQQLSSQEGNKILTIQEEKELSKYIEELKIQQKNELNSKYKKNKHIQNNQNEVSSLLELNKPFWKIEEGLDFYFLINVEIQEFSQAKYPEIIAYRQLASKKYQQFCQFSTLSKNPPSNLLIYDILQHIVIGITLYNKFNGDYLNDQFASYFCQLYDQSICKKLKQSSIQNSGYGQYTFILIKQKIVKEQKDIKLELKGWYQISFDAFRQVLKNKFLTIQLFLRLLESFEKQYQRQCILEQKSQSFKHQKFEIKQISQKNQNKKLQNHQYNKFTKKYRNSILKRLKKIQFIISFYKDQSTQFQESILKNLTKEIILQERKIQNLAYQESKYQQIKELYGQKKDCNKERFKMFE